MIIVSSNCQTAGIAKTLSLIFPNNEIIPFPTPNLNDIVSRNKLNELLSKAEFWITDNERSNPHELAKKLTLKIVLIPNIYFNAFHPDITYAVVENSNEMTNLHYNSKLICWGYINSIEVDDVCSLFSEQNFFKLGYFEYWSESVKILKSIFLKSDFNKSDFNKFFLKIKRSGCFMHTFNHPKSHVITELCKIVSQKIVSLKSYQSNVFREIVVDDFLNDNIWPVYPYVADIFGVEGTFDWRINGVEITSLKSFVEFMFSSYQQNGISPNDLKPTADISSFDNILKPSISRKWNIPM